MTYGSHIGYMSVVNTRFINIYFNIKLEKGYPGNEILKVRETFCASI